MMIPNFISKCIGLTFFPCHRSWKSFSRKNVQFLEKMQHAQVFVLFFSLFKVSLTSTFLCIISQFKIFPFKHHVLIWFAWLCGHFFRIFLLSPEGDNSENRLENENAIITCNGHDAEAVNSFGFKSRFLTKKKKNLQNKQLKK